MSAAAETGHMCCLAVEHSPVAVVDICLVSITVLSWLQTTLLALQKTHCPASTEDTPRGNTEAGSCIGGHLGGNESIPFVISATVPSGTRGLLIMPSRSLTLFIKDSGLCFPFIRGTQARLPGRPRRPGDFLLTFLEQIFCRCFHSIQNELWALFLEILVPF